MRMQSSRALGGFLGDVESNPGFVDIRAGFGQIIDGADQVGRFDDEQRLAGFHDVARVCKHFQHTARVGRQNGSYAVFVEADFSRRFKVYIDRLLPGGLDANLVELFGRSLDQTAWRRIGLGRLRLFGRRRPSRKHEHCCQDYNYGRYYSETAPSFFGRINNVHTQACIMNSKPLK